MRKFQLITLSFCLIANFICGQNLDWGYAMGGTSSEEGNSIATDAAGNIYTAGHFAGTADLEPGSGVTNFTAGGRSDIFITKTDPFGNWIWTKIFTGTSGYNSVRQIAVDANGIYAGGRFEDTVDFDPGPKVKQLVSNGKADAYMLKLDLNGNLEWVHSFGAQHFDNLNAVDVDQYGNSYFAGVYRDTIYLDSNGVNKRITSAFNDGIIVKYSPNGSLIWAKTISGPSSDYIYGIRISDKGNIYFTGNATGAVDFDPDTSVFSHRGSGNNYHYVCKWDSTGKFNWVKSISAQSGAFGYAIDVDDKENVYTTGMYKNTLFADTGSGMKSYSGIGDYDIYIMKRRANGEHAWVKTFGGTGYDRAYDVKVGQNGDVYCTGYFADTVDFDPGAVVHKVGVQNRYDFMINRLDSTGKFKKVYHFPCSSSNYGKQLVIQKNGLLAVGNFFGTMDFDPSPATDNRRASGGDIFTLKLSSCKSVLVIDKVTACKPFTWIDGKTYTSSNTSATFLTSTSQGCDSVIRLNLTMNQINKSVTRSQSALTANATGASYQWINCDSANVAISGATMQSFTPTASGNYAVVINNGTCTDTSDCITFCIALDTSVTTGKNQLLANATVDTYQWLNCDLGNTPVSGATKASFTPTKSGNYAVVVSNNLCADTSSCYWVCKSFDTTVTVKSGSISSGQSGAKYQWINCDNGNTLVQGATQQDYTPTESGNYAVVLSDSACSDTSSCKYVTAVGVESLSKIYGQKLSIYPNPTKGKVSIELNYSEDNLKVELFSINGQKLLSKSLMNTSLIELNLDQPTGIYMLHVTNSVGDKAIVRIIKE